MSLARDTVLSAVSTIAGTGVRFAVTVMMARTLAPHAYGQFVFLQFVIDFLALVCAFGIPGLLTRFLPQVAGSDDLHNPLLRRLAAPMLAATALAVIAFLIYSRLDQRFGDVDSIVLVGWSLASILVTFLYAALQGLFRYDAVLAGNLAFAVAAPVSVIVFAREGSAGSGAVAITLAQLISLIAAVARWRIARHHPVSRATGEIPPAKLLATYGANLWITGLIASLVWSRGEFSILRWFGDNGDIALYATAVTLSGLINQGVGLLTGAITPHLVKRWSPDDPAQVEEILLGVTQITFLAACGLALILIGFGRTIVPTLFGASYADAYPILCLLALSGTSVVAGASHVVLQIESNAKFGLLTNAIALVLLLAISVALAPIYGVIGAAIGRAVSQVFVAGLTFRQLTRVAALRTAARRIRRCWIAVLGMVGMAAAIFFFLEPSLPVAGASVSTMMLLTILMTRRIMGTPLTAILKLR